MFAGNGCFYIIQVNNENTKTVKLCMKLTIETSEFRNWRSFNSVFVSINRCHCVVFVDFENFICFWKI